MSYQRMDLEVELKGEERTISRTLVDRYVVMFDHIVISSKGRVIL